MLTTPASLLDRLGDRPAAGDWPRFVRLYGPVVFHWARRAGLQEADAADVVQDVFAALVVKLPAFRYDRSGRFRGWLRAVTLNRCRDRHRRARADPGPAAADPPDPPDPGPPPADAVADADERAALIRRALQLMQTDFRPETWRACWEVVAEGRPAAAVAADLGLTVGAVHAARFRVLARLRREFAGLA